MPQVDVVAECFVRCRPAEVAAVLRQPGVQAALWPGLRLAVAEDRGGQGLRWTVRDALVASCECWVQAVGETTILHCYLRTDPAARTGRLGGLRVERQTRRWRRRLVATMWQLKDELERR